MFFGELLAQGGWAMAPIYLCSVLATVVFVRKALVLHRVSRVPGEGGRAGWLTRVAVRVRARDLAGVQEVAAGVRHPAAQVVVAATRVGVDQPGRAEAEGLSAGTMALVELERGVGLLGFIAQAAPLLGLLGTVLGMVDLFGGLEGGGLGNVDASLLAAGIWKALLTTAGGLMVAVPALAGHAWLTSRIDVIRVEMNDALAATLTALAAEPAGDEVPAAGMVDASKDVPRSGRAPEPPVRARPRSGAQRSREAPTHAAVEVPDGV